MEEWRGNVSCSRAKERRSPWAWVGGEDLLGKGYQTGVLDKSSLQWEERHKEGILLIEDNNKG